jgi:steroid 5-alpha reductase family enzyme
MTHRATPRFWSCYRRLPEEVRRLADRGYELIKSDPRHPSLHFKKIGELWSVRVGLHYQALAVEDGEDLLWVWIGTHAEYDRLVQGS